MLYAGTSGWSYPSWKPTFYPPKLAAAKFLQYYATRLNTVEVNYTFRHFAAEKTQQGPLTPTACLTIGPSREKDPGPIIPRYRTISIDEVMELNQTLAAFSYESAIAEPGLDSLSLRKMLGAFLGTSAVIQRAKAAAMYRYWGPLR